MDPSVSEENALSVSNMFLKKLVSTYNITWFYIPDDNNLRAGFTVTSDCTTFSQTLELIGVKQEYQLPHSDKHSKSHIMILKSVSI